MKKFTKGDRVKLINIDSKVRNQEGIVRRSTAKQTEVVLELWCKWGTYTNYFPLWITNNQLEKIA